ncbi:hypothetical protein TNCV_2748221 [Trichonephila clavipes]|nr:hypothetical protein TNCV_2748221 [Trichonephila clavipes]
MSPGRCNTGLTSPRHDEYQIINLILGEYYTTHQAMPSEVPVDSWEGVDRLQFVGQTYPTCSIDSSPVTPLRHGGTQNSSQAASPFVRLVEGEERWEVSDHPQGVLLQNWDGKKPNHTVTCLVFKATTGV